MMHLNTQPRRVTLTPEDVQALGYEPRYTHPKNDRAVVDYYTPGTTIDTPAGRQADGTHLYLLDLDEHQADQNATKQLERIVQRVGPALAAKLTIKRSRGGQGYHLPFRTHRAVSELPTVKVYDPLVPADHIGELIGPGGRVTLTGDYLQGGPESIPLLSAMELDKLSAAIHTPALYREYQPANGAATTPRIINGLTPRKQRMAEGLSLITGWEHITDARAQLDTYCTQYPELAKRRATVRTDPDRSAAYARFVQSLMLHAWRFGSTTPERCTRVAAFAIAHGANGKEQERDYKIERDTAVLIARILNGDRYESGDGHFAVPGWANRYQTAPATTTHTPKAPQRPPSTPHPRTPGRPAGNRAEAVERLYRVLEAIEPDGFGRRVYTLETLAGDLQQRFKLKAAPRTMSGYLSTLRTQGRITTGQVAGNGMAFCLLTSDFGDAANSQKRVNAPTKSTESGGAYAPPVLPTPTPQTTADTPQCIKEEGAPKVTCVPASAGRGAQPALGVPSGRSAARASAPVASEPSGASYDPTEDFTAKPAPRGKRAKKTLAGQRLDASAKRWQRWETLYDCAGGGSCGLSVLKGEQHKLRHTARKRGGAVAKALTAQADELQRLIDRYQSAALIAFFHPEPVAPAPRVASDSAESAKAASIHPNLLPRWRAAAAAGDLDWIAQRCDSELDVARVAAAVLALPTVAITG